MPKRKPILWTPERVTRWRDSGGTWRQGPVMVWTPQQTGEFLDAIEGDRLYPLYSLAAFAGLRRAEVAGLPWSETDLDGGRLRSGRPGQMMTRTRTTRSRKPVPGRSRCRPRWPPC